MASQIVGTSIISDSYGTMLPTLPDRPEPVRRELVWLDKPALLKRQKWTEADFEAAIACTEPIKFPTAQKRFRAGRIVLVWSDEAIETWAARVANHIAVLRALIRQR